MADRIGEPRLSDVKIFQISAVRVGPRARRGREHSGFRWFRRSSHTLETMLGHAVDATEGNEVLDYYTAREDEYEAQWLRHFAPAGGATSRSEYRETAEDYTETAAGPAPEEEVPDPSEDAPGDEDRQEGSPPLDEEVPDAVGKPALDPMEVAAGGAEVSRGAGFLKRTEMEGSWLDPRPMLDVPRPGPAKASKVQEEALRLRPFTSSFMRQPGRVADLVDTPDPRFAIFKRMPKGPQCNPRRLKKQVRWLTCGLFTVAKKNGSLRLIIDARNANKILPRIHGLIMFELEQLLSAMQELPFAWAVDFRHYFYELPISDQLGAFFSHKFGGVWCQPKCLPMGYSNAPIAAQTMTWLMVLYREVDESPLGVTALPEAMPGVLRVRDGDQEARIFVLLDNVAVFASSADFRDKWAARIKRNYQHFQVKESSPPTLSNGPEPIEFCGIKREMRGGVAGWFPSSKFPVSLSSDPAWPAAAVSSLLGKVQWAARALQIDTLAYEEVLRLASRVGKLQQMPRAKRTELVSVEPLARAQLTELLRIARASQEGGSADFCTSLRDHPGRAPVPGSRSKFLFAAADARQTIRAAMRLDEGAGGPTVSNVTLRDHRGSRCELDGGGSPPQLAPGEVPPPSTVSELEALELAVELCGNGLHRPANERLLLVAEDNTGAERAIRRGHSSSAAVREVLRRVYEKAAARNVRIVTVRVGTKEIVSDVPTRSPKEALTDPRHPGYAEAQLRLCATMSRLRTVAAELRAKTSRPVAMF